MNKKATKYTAFFVLGSLAVIAVLGLAMMLSSNDNLTGLNNYYLAESKIYGGAANELSGQAYYTPISERTRTRNRYDAETGQIISFQGSSITREKSKRSLERTPSYVYSQGQPAKLKKSLWESSKTLDPNYMPDVLKEVSGTMQEKRALEGKMEIFNGVAYKWGCEFVVEKGFVCKLKKV